MVSWCLDTLARLTLEWGISDDEIGNKCVWQRGLAAWLGSVVGGSNVLSSRIGGRSLLAGPIINSVLGEHAFDNGRHYKNTADSHEPVNP